MSALEAGRRSPLRRLAMLTAALLTAPVFSVVMGVATAAPAHAAGSPGAPVPFTEYLAATSSGVSTNGTVLPVDYDLGTLQSEATGRQAVELIGQGQYISFTLTSAANAVDFHYSIPDSLGGGGITEPLDLYTGSTLTTSLSLSSQYAWLYGTQATVTNTPGVGEADTLVPHDFFDDIRYQFSSTLQAGTVVKLQVDAGDNSPWYAINTADFYDVAAPIAQPSNAINVTQSPYNANNTGSADDTQALQNAINAAQSSGQTVYIPQGTYSISNPLNVNNVTVEGAGEWYTTMTGSNVEFAGNGSNINVSNLAIFGNVNTRVDSDGSVNGFNGTFSNSTINDVWIQNTKVGAWILGPTNGLTIENVQIQDTTADGVNFNAAAGAITNSTVEDSFLRNTQDDGLAMWAENSGDTNDTFTQNTVDSPGVANNIALYGDTAGGQVTNNLLQDTVTRGGGIGIGQRFSSTAVSGTTTVSGNELVRTGQYDPGWNYGIGAVWFWPQQGNMNATYNIDDNTILDSPYEAFMFQNENMYDGSAVTTPPTAGFNITGVTLSGNTVTNVGTFVFQDQAPGSVEVDNTTATGVGVAGQFVCGSGFTLTQGSGDSGFSSTTCGMPNSWPMWAYPGVTTFENATVGQTTPTQRIAVMNTGAAGASLGAISASSGFVVSQDSSDPCGSTLAPTVPGSTAVWCAVDVSFTAPSSGITTGTLTIPSGEPGSPTTVQLVGSTGSNTVNTPPTLTPGGLSFGYVNVGSTSAAQTVTLKNPAASAITVASVGASGPFAQTNNCVGTLAAGASCTISVTFTPTAGGAQSGQLSVTNSATSSPIVAGLSGTGLSSTTNLALTASMTSSSTESGFPAGNANDGNTSTYWESSDGAGYPQTLTANLGQSFSLGSVTLTLPPSTAWSTRTETLSVLGSTNGTSFTTLVPSANYTFNPSSGNNTVSFNLPSGTNEQYLQLSFTANTGWTAAQISEFEIFPGSGTNTGGGSATLSASPTSLSFGSQTVNSTSASQTVTVSNTGTAAASISSITVPTGYSETNTCGSSLAAGASCTVSVTFTPTAAGSASANLTVSSNASNSTLTIGLSGTGTSGGGGGTPTNLALNAPITASSNTQTYVASNADDGNTSTYWESATGAFPATLAVNLGASDSLSSVVIDLPPATAWSTRTQTLSVLGSANGSSYTTLVGSATYTWNPSTGNTVTITLPSGTTDQYVELSFTANSVQNAGQVSEFEVMGTGGSTNSNTNLALNKSATASSFTQTYVAANAVDGNTGTYWEATDGTWPSTLTVNLGSAQTLGSVVIDLPSSWGTRTQTLSVLGSANGSSFTTLVGSATYTWNPSTGDSVTITLPSGTSEQYVELSSTANDVQNGAQVSEFEIFG
ncbi:MAG TPA: discoidin domain-containing protein [Actinocrinis sp.]